MVPVLILFCPPCSLQGKKMLVICVVVMRPRKIFSLQGYPEKKSVLILPTENHYGHLANDEIFLVLKCVVARGGNGLPR